MLTKPQRFLSAACTVETDVHSNTPCSAMYSIIQWQAPPCCDTCSARHVLARILCPQSLVCDQKFRCLLIRILQFFRPVRQDNYRQDQNLLSSKYTKVHGRQPASGCPLECYRIEYCNCKRSSCQKSCRHLLKTAQLATCCHFIISPAVPDGAHSTRLQTQT